MAWVWKESEEEKRRENFNRQHILLGQFRDESSANQYANSISNALDPIVRVGQASRPGGGPATTWYYVYIRRP